MAASLTQPAFRPPGDADAAQIRAKLSAWFEAHQRDLPWRETRDPYAVWVSEAMLQQTRVEVVLDYWPRFLRAFPTVAALADADEESVLEAWSGLGYYRRARSLQAAAQVIVAEHDGMFPRRLEDALALPGIGPYTAGAVLSIALDRPTPIVDGNVERVFSRLFEIDGVRTSGPLLRAAWEAARFFLAREEDGVSPRVWNQALMELGALVCTPRSPECGACPLAGTCAARASGRQAELPRAKAKRVMLDVSLEIYVVEREGTWLVTRRPGQGRMAGMWEFPTVEVTGSGLYPDELEGHPVRDIEPEHDLFDIRHGITHHRIRARVRAATCGASGRGGRGGRDGPASGSTGESAEASAEANVQWRDAAGLGELALTGMARKVLARFDSATGTLFGAT